MKKCSTFDDKKVTMSKIEVDTSVYKAAMAYIQTISATGGKPVPADENGKGAVADEKYSL